MARKREFHPFIFIRGLDLILHVLGFSLLFSSPSPLSGYFYCPLHLPTAPRSSRLLKYSHRLQDIITAS